MAQTAATAQRARPAATARQANRAAKTRVACARAVTDPRVVQLARRPVVARVAEAAMQDTAIAPARLAPTRSAYRTAVASAVPAVTRRPRRRTAMRAETAS